MKRILSDVVYSAIVHCTTNGMSKKEIKEVVGFVIDNVNMNDKFEMVENYNHVCGEMKQVGVISFCPFCGLII